MTGIVVSLTVMLNEMFDMPCDNDCDGPDRCVFGLALQAFEALPAEPTELLQAGCVVHLVCFVTGTVVTVETMSNDLSVTLQDDDCDGA